MGVWNNILVFETKFPDTVNGIVNRNVCVKTLEVDREQETVFIEATDFQKFN